MRRRNSLLLFYTQESLECSVRSFFFEMCFSVFLLQTCVKLGWCEEFWSKHFVLMWCLLLKHPVCKGLNGGLFASNSVFLSKLDSAGISDEQKSLHSARLECHSSFYQSQNDEPLGIWSMHKASSSESNRYVKEIRWILSSLGTNPTHMTPPIPLVRVRK